MANDMDDAERTVADVRQEVEKHEREADRLRQEAAGIDRPLREDARVQGYGKAWLERRGLLESTREEFEKNDPIAGNRHIWTEEWMTRDGWTLGKNQAGHEVWTRQSKTQA